jgi:chromosome segregation ATPase
MAYYRWRSPADLAKLEQDLAASRTVVVQLRRELEYEQHTVSKLQVLVHERSERIDELRGRLEQTRAQVRRLDAENDRLASIIEMT